MRPPHQGVGFGIVAISWGGVILIVGRMNRAQEMLRKRLQWLLLALGGLIITHFMMGRLEWNDRAFMHSGVFYWALGAGLPFALESFARAAGLRWGRTTLAAIYTAFFLLAEWVVPLFAAQPQLGPVYQVVTHIVPLGFPVLLLAPAIALDLLWPRLNSIWPQLGFWNKWSQSFVAGVVFVAALMAAPWPF